MPFDQGSVSFRQFNVVGQAPKEPDQGVLDKLAAQAFEDSGQFEEVEYGWGGGEHLYDSTFSFEKNVFSECLSFALRIDTNKPSGDVVRAYTKIEEAAVAKGNPSGFLSKAQKREVKETVRQKVEAERREGKYQKSRLIQILWDMPRGRLLANVTGANLEKLMEIFERTFGLDLFAITAGILASRVIRDTKTLEDLRPSRFGTPPLDAAMFPEYPWVAKTNDPRGFLGDEFLLWAVWNARVGGEAIGADLLFDGKLELECAYGVTGKHSIKGNSPDRLPEVHEAMRSGKVPRKAGVMGNIHGGAFEFYFHPEVFGFGGTKLPLIEDAETVRQVFEERIGFVRELTDAMEAAFGVFMKLRASSEWEGVREEIEAWVGKPMDEAAKAKGKRRAMAGAK